MLVLKNQSLSILKIFPQAKILFWLEEKKAKAIINSISEKHLWSAETEIIQKVKI